MHGRWYTLIFVAAALLLGGLCLAVVLHEPMLDAEREQYVRCWLPGGSMLYQGHSFGEVRTHKSGRVVFVTRASRERITFVGATCIIGPPRK